MTDRNLFGRKLLLRWNFYFKVPASQRYQEREISKFRGENIPSKTFKYLQYITQEELALEQQEAKANPRKEVAHVTQQRTVIASQPVNYESNVVSRPQVGNPQLTTQHLLRPNRNQRPPRKRLHATPVQYWTRFLLFQ